MGCGGCFRAIDDAISPGGVGLPSVSGIDEIGPKSGEKTKSKIYGTNKNM